MTGAEQGRSPENPWPVRAVATRVAKYIDRLGMVWVEVVMAVGSEGNPFGRVLL